jgi:hypothetical protein
VKYFMNNQVILYMRMCMRICSCANKAEKMHWRTGDERKAEHGPQTGSWRREAFERTCARTHTHIASSSISIEPLYKILAKRRTCWPGALQTLAKAKTDPPKGQKRPRDQLANTSPQALTCANPPSRAYLSTLNACPCVGECDRGLC